MEAYYDQQIYLNHKLIENKQLSLTEIQEKSAEFLVQFSGVSEVYSAHRLLLGPWSPQIERIRNGFHRKRSGDLPKESCPREQKDGASLLLINTVKGAHIFDRLPLKREGWTLEEAAADKYTDYRKCVALRHVSGQRRPAG